MKRLLAVLAFLILAGCSGQSGFVRPLTDGKPRTIFVDKLESDGYGLNGRVEMALVRAGFNPVPDLEKANYRLRVMFDWDKYDMTAMVSLSEISTGNTIFYGEGKNHGFGTAINRGQAMSGCLDRALQNLR